MYKGILNAQKISVIKLDRKRSHGRSKHRRDNNITSGLKINMV
jgi:hypothetical protein